jgi:hypothetical protein
MLRLLFAALGFGSQQKSSVAIVAILGLTAYFLATPLTPTQRIAAGHAAVNEVVTR